MTTRLILACCLAAGCATDDTSPTPTDTLPTTSGSYAGRYVVPTTPELAAAGTFEVARIDWRVTGNGVVHFSYDLPVGLVGGTVSIDMQGTVGSGDFTGDRGTATCTVAKSIVTCNEQLANLGDLPLDDQLVEARAAAEYAGPAADRVQVANVFSSDPIGIASFDLTQPVDD